MTLVNMHEAKSKLSALVEMVEQGEEVIIAKSGTPKVRLVKMDETPIVKKPGMFQGKYTVPDGFDEEDDAITKLFEGI